MNIRLYTSICILLLCSKTIAQKAMIKLEISPQNPVVGEIIQVTIRSNISGDIEIDYPSAFVHGYNIMNGMNQEIDYTTGKIVSYSYMSESGTIGKPGTYTFGPAYIKKGAKVYKSNTISVTVKKESNSSVPDISQLSSKQLKQPAFGIIERSKSSIYEGEPLVVNAKVYASFNPTQIENYQSYSLDGVIEKHEISSLSDQIMVDQERVRQRTFYTFTCDKQVLFPTGTGKVVIDPFKLILISGFESFPLTSNANSITIKPLPDGAPGSFIGVVGKINVTSHLDYEKVKQGEVLTLTIQLDGHGNLQNAMQPKLNLPKGMEQYGDVIVKEELDYGINGAQGTITYQYHIRFNSASISVLPSFPISYFDPNKGIYSTISTETIPIKVVPVKNYKAPIHTAGSDKTIQEVSSGEFPFRSNEIETNSSMGIPPGLLWTGVLTPIVLSLIAGFYFRKQTSVSKSTSTAKRNASLCKQFISDAKCAYREGDVQTSLLKLEKGLYSPLETRSDLQELLAQMDKKKALELALRDRGLSDENISETVQIINEIEQQRYGFLQSIQIGQLLQQGEKISNSL